MSNLTVSWSGLRRYEECHAKALYYKQKKQHAVTDGRMFLPGTIADRVMRQWLESDDPQPGQMPDMVEEYFRRYAEPETDEERQEAQYVIKWRGDPVRDKRNVINFVREVVTELEPILLKWVIPHDYQPELRFRTTIGIPYLDGRITGVDLIGGIDVVTRYSPISDEFPFGRFRLFDLKATVSDSYINTTVGQATFYSIAWGHYIGDRSQPDQDFGFIAPALKNKIHWATITEDDKRAMMSRIIAYCHGVWRKEWEPKKSDSGCTMCDCRHVCEKFKVDLHKDKIGRNRASFEKAAHRRTSNRERDGE